MQARGAENNAQRRKQNPTRSAGEVGAAGRFFWRVKTHLSILVTAPFVQVSLAL